HNQIEPGDRIGFDPDADRRRFHVSDSGITVIGSGPKSYFARSAR
ncbi:MAG: glucose-1-phosphate adenylyltransferase, partial [Thioalkalivibrio sp.]